MKTPILIMIGYLLIAAYTVIAWIVNLVMFIQCDFTEPFKEEIVRGIGIIFPPVSWIVVWISF